MQFTNKKEHFNIFNINEVPKSFSFMIENHCSIASFRIFFCCFLLFIGNRKKYGTLLLLTFRSNNGRCILYITSYLYVWGIVDGTEVAPTDLNALAKFNIRKNKALVMR